MNANCRRTCESIDLSIRAVQEASDACGLIWKQYCIAQACGDMVACEVEVAIAFFAWLVGLELCLETVLLRGVLNLAFHREEEGGEGDDELYELHGGAVRWLSQLMVCTDLIVCCERCLVVRWKCKFIESVLIGKDGLFTPTYSKHSYLMQGTVRSEGEDHMLHYATATVRHKPGWPRCTTEILRSQPDSILTSSRS